jgi:uncharacterized membrane protein
MESAEQDRRDQDIKELILSVLVHERPSSVRDLVSGVLARVETDLSSLDVVRLIQEMNEEGKIVLSKPKREFATFRAYLIDLNSSLQFWLVLLAIILTWLFIYAIPSEFPWIIPRWILGTLFVIFLPGYSFIEALFVNPLSKKKEIDEIERFALSIGMSLALVPLVGLLLNYTPWGIRLEPTIFSLSILTLACIIVANYRKFVQNSKVVSVEAV